MKTSNSKQVIVKLALGAMLASGMPGLVKAEEAASSGAAKTAPAAGKATEAEASAAVKAAGGGDVNTILANYREIATKGGWPEIAKGNALKKGDDGERVATMRKRLAITGELDPSLDNGSTLFDEAVEAAVMKFQERHGEEPDGVAGPETLAAMNIPVEHRIAQLEKAAHRYGGVQHIPHDRIGSRYLVVNIPDFMLYGYENGQRTLEMRVIVGKDYQSTPTFSDEIETVVFNPDWGVPPSIAEKEIMPKVKADPDYLKKNNMVLIKGKKGGYQIRQKPGAKNALGRLKFLFPNKHNVYLHDTPNDSLFNKNERAFSHGCIRVEFPEKLAEWVLRGEPKKWTEGSIRATIQTGQTKTVRLKHKLPVHIDYQTAWVADGKVHFREDIYGHDGNPVEALAKYSLEEKKELPGGSKTSTAIGG